MQLENQTDSLSYFALAAIHGLPVQKWENAAPPRGSWYCHHGVNTFPTWHRPYCGLFEVCHLYESLLVLTVTPH